MTVDATIWDLVAARAAEDAAAGALVGTTTWSRGQLCAAAVRLSRRIDAVVPAGAVVAIAAQRTETVLLAVLACARIRRAFVAMDPAAPPAHNEFVLGDCGAIAVVEDGPFEEPLVRVVDLPAVVEVSAAYVMYTSGSTGRPKGVAVAAQSLLLRLEGLRHNPGLRDGSRMLAMASPCFDISLIEMLLPLYVGGTVVVAPPGTRIDPELFARVVGEYRPDVVQATPSFWRLALALGWCPPDGIAIWSGGEPMTAELAGQLLRPGIDLFNLYGPTETTLWATAGRVDVGGAVGIGVPLLGLRLELHDEQGEVVGNGVRGEIVLCGDGIATGYLGLPDLSATRFGGWTGINPASSYRTGDIGVRRPDGTVSFVGRTDSQVKIRGHRVELNGLEAVAEAHPQVSQAVMVLREPDNPARTHIAAFVVGDFALDVRSLRHWFAAHVPQGARPTRITIVAGLPRTPSGKVDRVALAAHA